MKAKDLRTKSLADVSKEVSKLRSKLATLRKDNATKEMKNNREIRETRRDLARALTVQGELSRAGGNAVGATPKKEDK